MATASIWPFSRQNINGTNTWNPDQRTPWDIVSLGSYTFPGICKILNLSRARKYQVVKNKETHYGDVKDLNLELAMFTIENTIIRPEDYGKLIEIIQYLNTKLGVNNKVPGNSNNYKIDAVSGLPRAPQRKTITTNLPRAPIDAADLPKAPTVIPIIEDLDPIVTGSVNSLSVIHPKLRDMDVSSCFVIKISGPDEYRVGKIVTRFDCIEVRKKLQSTSKSIEPASQIDATPSTYIDLKEVAPPSQNPAVIGP